MVENSRKPWTAEEDERLRQLVVSGAPLAEIAERLDRTELAAKARPHFLRVTRSGVLDPSGAAHQDGAEGEMTDFLTA
jgi:hypothetical protein